MANRFDRLLLAKIEGTKGVDATPVPASDAVRCRTFEITKNSEVLDNVAVRQTMGMEPHVIGKEGVQIEIEIALKGSGAAGTAPEYGPLLRACGLTETVVPATSVTYDPTSDVPNHEACTIYGYKDGLLWKFVGATGTFTITEEMNAITLLNFTMQAPYVEPTAVADPGGAVYQSTQPLVGTSSDVINDGAAIKVGSFTLDAGNDVQEHYVTGNHEFTVADRSPTVTFTKDSVSTVAEWQALSNVTTAALSATLGSVAGNICTITAVDARRENVGYDERAERDLLEVTHRLYESSGDDQYAIAYT